MVLLFKGMRGIVSWSFPACPLGVIEPLSFIHERHFCTLSSIQPLPQDNSSEPQRDHFSSLEETDPGPG